MEDKERKIDRKVLERIPKKWGRYVSCGEGWFDLIEKLDEELAKIDPDYILYQCKEKFGGLRYYTGHSDDSKLSEEAYEEFRQLVRVGEADSYKICETCGTEESVEHRVIGYWHITLCEEHYLEECKRDKESKG